MVFIYTDLTPEIVNDVVRVSLAGQTTVVLGPPYVGKSLFIAKLENALKSLSALLSEKIDSAAED